MKWAPALLAVSLMSSMLVADVASAEVAKSGSPLVHLSKKPQLPPDAKRLSAVKPSQPFTLTIGLAPRRPQAFDAFVQAVTTPGTAQFGKHLARGEYAKRFGPTAASIEPLTKSLQAAGFVVSPFHAARQFLKARGSAETISTFFHTTMANYETADGTRHFSVTSAPKIDQSLKTLITGISGLGSFNTLSPSVTKQTHAAVAAPSCQAASDLATSGYGITTTQLATAYGLDRYYSAGNTGQGVTVGIYELARYKASDISTYASCYGVTPNIVNVNVDGGPPQYSAAASSDATEPTLDIDHVISVAPSANIMVYQAPNSTAANPSSPNNLLARIAADDLAQVITTSWGLCESDNPDPGGVNFENGLFKQMAAQGQTFIAASGDNGPADCAGNSSDPVDTSDAVDDPASQPYVTGVGATRTTSFSPLVQSAWGRGSLSGGGSGGGLSAVWPRPNWQVVASSDVRVTAATKRMVPDVSLNGDPRSGVLIYQADQGGWFPIGGTSAASPLLAAVVALADVLCQRSVGFMNPSLYRAALASPANFNDVTAGSNSVGTKTLFTATSGYDLASGLGTPLGGALDSLCAAAPSTTSTSTLIGRPTNLALTFSTTAELNAGDTMVVTWPSGLTLPSNPVSLSATANGNEAPLVWKSTGAASPSVTPNQVTYTVASRVSTGSLMVMSATAAINPSSKVPQAVSVTASPSTWVLVGTSLPQLTGLTHAWASRDVTAANRALSGKATLGGLLVNQQLASQVAGVGSKVTLSSGTSPNLTTTTLSLSTLTRASGTFTGPVQLTKSGETFVLAGISTTGHLLIARSTAVKSKWTVFDLTKSAGLGSAQAAAVCLSTIGSSPVASGALKLNNGHLLSFTATSSAATAFTTADLTTTTGLAIAQAPACAGDGNQLLIGARSTSGDLFALTVSGAAVLSATNVSATTTLGPLGSGPISVTVGPLGSALTATAATGRASLVTALTSLGPWTATSLASSAVSSAVVSSPVAICGQNHWLVVSWSKSSHLIVFSPTGPRATWNAYDATTTWGLSGSAAVLRGAVSTTSVILSWTSTAGHVIVASTQAAL